MRAPALPGLALLAFVGALVASVACSNQGEGQFCDTANGNSDCQDGLQCVAAPGLPSGLVNTNRCCPIPPAQATTPECSRNTGALDAATAVGDVFAQPEAAAEAGNPGEASATEASTPEASAAEASAAEASVAEASTDSGPDGGSPDALPE
jgi:hypothetical protein